MSQTYQSRRRTQAKAPAEQQFHTDVPGPSMQELAAGAMPSTEQMGRRVDLPGAIREKMEASFGADFSGVKLYESQTVADAGANAMTMGSSIAFAPGQLDLTTTSGQALLGHELSHVVSQAKGESAGRGFLADSGLEAQADRQGAMAARGEGVYTGPATPLSASAVPAATAGVAQAKKKKTIARDALKKGNATNGAEFRTLRRAEERYQFQNNTLPEYQMGFKGARQRYMQYAMQRRGEEEQDDILNAFVTNDMSAISRFVADDIRALNQTDFSGLNSEDFETRADAYSRSARPMNHMNAISDLIGSEDLDAYLYGDESTVGAIDRDAVDEFTHRHEALRMDREYAQDDMLSTAGERYILHPDEERKAYRRYRRNPQNGTGG